MTPLDELEVLLAVALQVGDREQIEKLAAEIDALPPPSPVPPLSAALWYAEQGLPVIALKAGSKLPHKGTRGSLDATVHEHEIRAWWDRWPDSNVGIATGYVVDIVDIDGLEGQTSRAKHWERFESLTTLGSVLTPRPGGMHLYVPAKPGASNGASRMADGIDYRGRGGYVVAPTSVTDVGTYRWLRPLVIA